MIGSGRPYLHSLVDAACSDDVDSLRIFRAFTVGADAIGFRV